MNIKLKQITPIPPKPIYRATLHRTGKIGLAIDTAKEFGFTTSKCIALYVNDMDANDDSIYGVMYNAGQPDTFKILKAGDYHSIYAKDYFDTIKVDYAKGTINYVLTKISVDGHEVIKFEKVKKENGSGATAELE